MDFSKLFKLENKINFSEDLEEVSLKGKEDREIRKIILENFQKLFSHLELFKEKNYLIKITKYKDKIGNLFILLQSRDFEILNSSTSSENDIRELLKPL